MQVFPDRGVSTLAASSVGLAAQYTAALTTRVYDRDSVQAHINMQSESTACKVMPLMLSDLLKQRGWQGAGKVKTLVEALYAIHAHADCDDHLRSLVRKCLLAVRSEMDAAEIHKLSTVVDTPFDW